MSLKHPLTPHPPKRKKRDAVSAWIQVSKNTLFGNTKISNSLALILMPRRRKPCSSSIFTSWKTNNFDGDTIDPCALSSLSVFLCFARHAPEKAFNVRHLHITHADKHLLRPRFHVKCLPPSVNMHSRTFIKKRPVKISLYRFSVLNSCTDFLSDVVFFIFASLLAFTSIALPTLSPSCLSLVRRPLALTCQVPPDVGSLCQCPLSHRRTQGLVRLAICQGNPFQEITVNCWCVFHHGRHLNRLLEVCTCGNSVLCKRRSPKKQTCHQGRVSSSLVIISIWH